MGTLQKFNKLITSNRETNEIWSSLNSPDPFPGNLFIDSNKKYVCYPLGSGVSGGYRFEFEKQNWLIMRLNFIDPKLKCIKWDLVDIKKSSIRKMSVEISINQLETYNQVIIDVALEYSFLSNIFKIFHNHKMRSRLSKFSIENA